MRVTVFVGLGVVALGCAACESPYIYQPAAHANAQVQGHSAANYSLPNAEAARGEIRVASFGLAKIAEKKGETVHALHVREVVSNNADRPWSIDIHQQQVQLKDGRTLLPAYAQSDVGNLPALIVPPSGKRTIDLFFPLPPDQEKASRIPEFDVLWRVSLDGQVISQRTPFERLQVTPYYASTGWGYPYFGSYGWYDPFWGPATIGVPGWYW